MLDCPCVDAIDFCVGEPEPSVLYIDLGCPDRSVLAAGSETLLIGNQTGPDGWAGMLSEQNLVERFTLRSLLFFYSGGARVEHSTPSKIVSFQPGTLQDGSGKR